jgi:hypothetical protein
MGSAWDEECLDWLSAGYGVISKKITNITFHPGGCLVTGGPTGEAVPAEPTTFCCLMP